MIWEGLKMSHFL